MALTPSTMVSLATSCPDFSLVDVTRGTVVSRRDFSNKPLLVMFICNHCPYVVHIQGKLAAMTRVLEAQSIAVIGICSNDMKTYPADGPTAMAKTAKANGWSFPYLHDESQSVAKAFGAACTPDFFLFNSAHELVYRGQFDSSRPGSGVPVSGEDILAAARALAEGRAPSSKQLPSMGCNIKWRPENAPRH